MSPDASGLLWQAFSALAIAFDEVVDVGCTLDGGGALAADPLAAQLLTSRAPASVTPTSRHIGWDRLCCTARFTELDPTLPPCAGRSSRQIVAP